MKEDAMIGRIFIVLLLTALALPAYAGQTVIRETDAGYEVEYIPDPEEAKAIEVQKEQEEKKLAVDEAKKRQIEEKNAAKRAKSAARKARERAEEGE
jgi:hypothetical protein